VFEVYGETPDPAAFFWWLFLFLSKECPTNNLLEHNSFSSCRYRPIRILSNSVRHNLISVLDSAVAYPGILFEGGSINSVEDRENGDLEAVAP